MGGVPPVDAGPELIEREYESEVRSSHLAMVSHPAEVVRFIEAAANASAAVK